MKYRNDKVAVSIQKYVSDIIQFKVKNKDLGICSVTHCEVTNDYSYARLYISFLGNRKQEKMEELQRVKGFIRTELSKKLRLFKTPDLQFILLDLIKNPNQEKVVEFFDELEEKIGTDAFIEMIPVILTDRDPNFTDIEGICFSKITGEERCKLFFCDGYVSNQKPNVENINKQLRLFFPKGKTIDTYKKQDIKNVNQTLINRPLKSLDSYTPKEAFITVFDEELFNKLF